MNGTERLAIGIEVSWQRILAFAADRAGSRAGVVVHENLLGRAELHVTYPMLGRFPSTGEKIGRIDAIREDAAMSDWKRAGIGGAGAMFVAMGLGRFSYSAMVPALISSGQLTAEQAGWIGGLNLAGFFVGAFTSDAIRRRWPMPLVLTAAVGVSLIGLAASAVPAGFVWLAVWRSLLGVCAGLIMVQGLALTTGKAPVSRRAAAAALMFSGVGVGIAFSGVLVPWLLSYGLGWGWLGIAAVGAVGAGVAYFGWRNIEVIESAAGEASGLRILLGQANPWRGLAAGYFLFSFGITPHTLYWVDFLARELALGIDVGGAHWAAVGVFAVVGPWAAVGLARRTQTSWAVVVAFVVLGFGIVAPAITVIAPVLWLSSIVFGAQPGVSTVKAARARDLASASAMPAVMRVMIMSSALGAAVGGMAFPALFAVNGRFELLFAVGGGAMFVAALATAPRRHEAV